MFEMFKPLHEPTHTSYRWTDVNGNTSRDLFDLPANSFDHWGWILESGLNFVGRQWAESHIMLNIMLFA